MDVVPGLWLWRLPYPDWRPGLGWEQHVSSTCVESGGEVALLDPLAPPEDDEEVWARLDASPPTLVVVLKPDHVRDVDLFVCRDGCSAFGSVAVLAQQHPQTELEPIEPGSELPGGLVALYDGRGRIETPPWLLEQQTLVCADALIAPGGELRVWATPTLEERRCRCSGRCWSGRSSARSSRTVTPVHDRSEFERALERPPWTGER